jgi:hypothetical protein
MQALPQRESPPPQDMPQLPPEHVAVPKLGAGHTVPQVPQFFGSLAVSAHEPAQFCVAARQNRVHEDPPPSLPSLTRAQTGAAAGQVTPHAPQFVADSRDVAHPAPRCVQSSYPAAHEYVHRPAMQARAAALTFGSWVQSCPQLPQLRMSVGSGAHDPPQFVDPSGQPASTGTSAPLSGAVVSESVVSASEAPSDAVATASERFGSGPSWDIASPAVPAASPPPMTT